MDHSVGPDAARDTIKRSAGNSADAGHRHLPSNSMNLKWTAVITACCAVVFGSAGLYRAHGQAEDAPQKSEPAAAAHAGMALAQGDPRKLAENIEAMVERLAAKLVINPKDVDGWRVLGWSYYNLERYVDAAEAYRRASELKQDSAILKSLQGEALVKAAKGWVRPNARRIFEGALALDPDDVRAGYFTGLAYEQNGNSRAAVKSWLKLLEKAPADAQWALDLRKQVTALAGNSGIDLAGRLPQVPATSAPIMVQSTQTQTPKGPTAEDIKNASEMSAEDRMAMIRGMVDGLAQRLKKSPNDPDGWIRLIRSRVFLKEHDAAATALSHAMKVFEKDPETQNRISSAATELGVKAN